MASSSSIKLLAVLIDGDNFPVDLSDALFAAVAKLGTTAIRRVYGSSAAINGWRKVSAKHDIGLHEAMPGKNATDMKLAIDAMDILHRGKIEGFCIVSSDSDFAELARRLREDGVTVNGFGESKAAGGFRQSCDSFLVLGRPVPDKITPVVQPSATKPLPVQSSAFSNWLKLLAQALAKLQTGAPTITLSALAQQVQLLDKHFSAKKYGSTTLKALIIKSGLQLNKVGGNWIVVLPAELRLAA